MVLVCAVLVYVMAAQVVGVEPAQRLGHVGVAGVDGVADQPGQVQRVGRGQVGVPGGGLAGRQLAQQVPQEPGVQVPQRPVHGEVVQFAP